MKSQANKKISFKRINELKLILIRMKMDIEHLGLKDNPEKFEIINEALTHTSAQFEYNHEKLEFLGDAVLRLAASEFIAKEFPNMKVGESSALRSQLVSDMWLAEVGKSIEIEKVLVIGPKAAADSSALATLQAESTEALIGAIYKCCKNIRQIHNWLYPYWIQSSLKVLKDPYRENPKSALQEWSQRNGFDLPNYQMKEQSKKHGDPRRFFCNVELGSKLMGEGWGGSRKEAEKEAAKKALKNING